MTKSTIASLLGADILPVGVVPRTSIVTLITYRDVMDCFNESKLPESLDFSRNELEEAIRSSVRMFPVSARLALEGKLNHSEEKPGKVSSPGLAGC